MPIPEKYLAKLCENNYYHVYNHASGRENLFANAGNYLYFMQKLDEHLSGYIEINAYCLMPNHFHLLIRVRDNTELSASALKYLAKFDNLNDCICRKFNNFFIAYTLAFNKQQDREGNLFRKPFRRIYVDNETYFTRLIYYIHVNPVHHGFVNDLNDYEWSSYKRYLIDTPSKLPKQKIWDWFGGKDKFIEFHTFQTKDDFEDIAPYIMEEN